MSGFREDLRAMNVGELRVAGATHSKNTRSLSGMDDTEVSTSASTLKHSVRFVFLTRRL
jgi:hypothetical protein